MPTYDYRCLNCKRRFDVFLTYAEYGVKVVLCPHCQSDQITRRINKVRVARPDSARLQDLSDPARLAAVDDDPVALGRMMREMGQQTGEELGPEFDEVVDRLEKGQSPDDIERELPDLGSSPAGGNSFSAGEDF